MSFVVTTPEWVTTAAENLAGIGSTLEQATASAASPTTGLAAAAADEVSAAISRVFGAFGEEFQAVSAQGAAFHAEFVRLISTSAAAYAGAEIANAAQTLVNAPVQTLLVNPIESGAQAISRAIAASPLLTPGTAATVPGGAYVQLFNNTVTNLQALGGAWLNNPLPFFRQFLANQLTYAQLIATGFANVIQNFPTILANLPTTIQAAIQQLLNYNAAAYIQQFIAAQIGFAQTFVTSATNGLSTLVAGLPAFGSQLQVAFGQLLTGNYEAAVSTFGLGVANLMVTGIDPGPVTITLNQNPLELIARMSPKLLGPLGDFFTIMNIPGQEAQFLTNLISPPLLRHVAQNFTNVLNTLTLPSISVEYVQPLAPQPGTVSSYFGVPLVLAYAAAGGPFNALSALATSAETINEALWAGDFLRAATTFIDAPAYALNGLLNQHNIINNVIQVPTNLPAGLPQTVTITLHVPVDGILVPPHPVTATVDPHATQFGINPFDVTVYGTPFMGLGPLLVNYVPQQLAAAIRPTG
ncbi:PE family protein [Mycobacterium asiaticum]|uniref:PE domain-containing protein n=1 Tax=Mycobacterium asiaticum TaxID=1790 RepID=A0A1A3KWI6_MYCAS|nr:PE family protein [Mycobacterium asiaticum]OBJ88794.1 hypothetical protein A5640_00065 [Mycobacterium asiaticum]